MIDKLLKKIGKLEKTNAFKLHLNTVTIYTFNDVLRIGRLQDILNNLKQYSRQEMNIEKNRLIADELKKLQRLCFIIEFCSGFHMNDKILGEEVIQTNPNPI